MATIRPFNAMLYTIDREEQLETLCCPPYDIIPPQMRDQLYALPHNAIHLELAPGEGAQRYENAAKTLSAWLEEGVLTSVGRDALYLYEEDFTVGGKKMYLRGLIARVKLEEFEKGVILPHEETLSGAKQDRFALMTATNCNFSPIYSMYLDDDSGIAPLIDGISDRKSDRAFTDRDGVTHRLWIETDEDICRGICAGFAEKKLYIADGHHRYETALRYRDFLREKNGGDAGNAEYVMMMLVNIDQPGLVVLPTHRILFGLADYDAEKAIAAMREGFSVTPIDKARAFAALEGAGNRFVFYTGAQAYLVELADMDLMYRYAPRRSAAYRSLDVAVLHQAILEPVFGIDDARLAAGTNLRYTRDVQEAFAAVDSHEAQAAFLLNPTRVRQIRDVAAAGEKMPQKSTYFYPKLTTGLVFNNFAF